MLFILIAFLNHSISFSQQQIPYRWQNAVIGGGGFVTGIVTSEAEKGLIYCKTDVGGAYRWDTVLQGWIPLNDDIIPANFGLQGIESIALDPSDPSKVYMAAGEYVLWSETAMLLSSDKGNNWTRVNVNFKCGGNDYGRSVDERLMFDPNLSSILYMGTREKGLYKSTNGGLNWSQLTSFPVTSTPGKTGVTFVKLIKSSGEKDKATPVIFAGVARKGTDNLYVSRDTGTTWEAVPNHIKNLMPVHAALAADSLLYIAYSDTSGPWGTSKGALYKYSINTGVFTDITPLNNRAAYSGISVYPQDPKILYTSTISGWPDIVYRSADGGNTWKDITTGANKKDQPYTEFHWVADVEVDPFDPDHVMFVTGYGIWSTYDASNIDKGEKINWYFTNKGLEETVVREIVSPTYGAPLLSVIGDYTGFRHENLDSSAFQGMFKPSIGTSNALAVASKMPGFVARAGDRAFYSLDNGIKWTEFKNLPTTGAKQGRMAISAKGTTLVWSPENETPYFTRDKGFSWIACAGITNKNLKVIADWQNDNYFYVYDPAGSVWVSNDGAASFTKASTVVRNGSGMVTTFEKEGHLWISAKANGLYFSEDHGSTFTKISSVQNVEAVSTGPAFPGQEYPCIYITGYINNVYGFYRSDDKGLSWVKINTNKQNFGGINVITADSRVPGRLYVTSNYNGRGILYGVPLVDCNGDSAGTAYYDDCGICADGNTGIVPCKKDCNGEVNGTASIDKCGICSGGNTGAQVDSCLSTTINTQQLKTLASFSPNPFDEFTILKSKQKVSYSIYNVFGNKIEEGFCEGSIILGKNLCSGVYFININNGSEKQISKIIKN